MVWAVSCIKLPSSSSSSELEDSEREERVRVDDWGLWREDVPRVAAALLRRDAIEGMDE